MSAQDVPHLAASVDDITCPWCGARPFHVTGDGKAWLIHTSDRLTGAPCPGKELMEGRRYWIAPTMKEGR